MSDSDQDDSDEWCSVEPESKRQRTYSDEAVSHSSYAQQKSEDEHKLGNSEHTYNAPHSRFLRYQEGCPPGPRLSQSSSPGEDYQPSPDSKDEKSSDESRSGHITLDTSKYGSAMHMMSKMGYKAGKGLGKHETGRTEPIETSKQKGRLGLGHIAPQLGSIPEDFNWSPDDSKPEAKEEVSWIPPTSRSDEDLTADKLEEWLRKGPKKHTIDDETGFCKESILKGVLSAKTVFDEYDGEEMRNARTRSNPYEKIGSLFFLNRAAVKMANMDAIYNFMFTDPKDREGKTILKKDELLYFADVCAGPGGFSEYVLYRKGWKAKGFGFTLRGANDFKLSDFYAGSPDTFSPYYGPKDNGDIFDPENLTDLKKHVLRQTDGKGVHFLMADGGFSVAGKENIQEILSKQLYLCQCLAALMLVRTGGHFVVKLFDIFTPFSVGLVYLMYRSFDKVSIHKPVTSRPANSERYLICKRKHSNSDIIERHLFRVNVYLWDHKDHEDDIVALVPSEELEEDNDFCNYVYNSNCVLGEKQIRSLLKIKQFCEDKTLREESQTAIREECLQLWKLPDQFRKQPQRMNPDETLSTIISMMKDPPRDASNLPALKTNLRAKPAVLENSKDIKNLKCIHDWYFEFLSSGKDSQECRFFLGTGSCQAFELKDRIWQSVSNLNLPAKTLVYGEIVREFCGEGGMQRHLRSLHIIDAVCLGGEDVSSKPLKDRLNQCELFCRAISKPCDPMSMPVHCKKLYSLANFSKAMDQLSFRRMKRGLDALTLDVKCRTESKQWFYVISSIVFLKEIKSPWESALSRKHGNVYFYRLVVSSKNEYSCTDSTHDLPDEACMNALETLEKRIEWYWEPASAVYNGTERKGEPGIRRKEMELYVLSKLKK